MIRSELIKMEMKNLRSKKSKLELIFKYISNFSIAHVLKREDLLTWVSDKLLNEQSHTIIIDNLLELIIIETHSLSRLNHERA